MKKFILIIASFFFCTNVYANTISKMDIDIFIEENGDALVTEIWEAKVNKGTEGYKQYFNLGNSDILDYKVSMNEENFETISYWDPDDTFSEKAYKAGINETSSGDEICFGISKYGNNRYILSYKVTNFVNHLADESADLVYWSIIPSEFAMEVDNVYVKIHSNFKYADKLAVWGYGYDGYAYVYDGYIELSTKNGLNSDEYVVVLIKFDYNTFNTSSTLDKSFTYYHDLAKEGSSPNKPSIFTTILRFLFGSLEFIVFIIALIFSVVFASKSANMSGTRKLDFSKTNKKLDGDIPYFREIPCKKDIFRAYWVASNFNLIKNQTDFLGAILLKWLNNGIITTQSVTSKILKKESKAVVFSNDKLPNTEVEIKLFNMMKESSGDGILEKDEFKKYCQKHYKEILDWFKDVLDYENDELIKEGMITVGTKRVLGFDKETYFVENQMRDEAIQMKGLKNFLKDFSTIKDRSAIEVKLLNEYLMYAQIFGIAQEVAKEFKRLYPDVLNDMEYDNIIFIHTISYSGVSSAQSRAQSYSSGGGGFSSSGGGGGSFGGGGGGGFR